MKPSLRGATHFAPAYPAARVITRLARVALVLALILAAALPSSAGDRRHGQRAVGKAFMWGEMPATMGGQPHELSGFSGLVAIAGGAGHGLALKPTAASGLGARTLLASWATAPPRTAARPCS